MSTYFCVDVTSACYQAIRVRDIFKSYAWDFTVEEVKFPVDSRLLREYRLSQKQSDCGCGSISELIGVIKV